MSKQDSFTRGVARRYATALFGLVQEMPAEKQSQIIADIAAICKILTENDEVGRLITNPIIGAVELEAALVGILTRVKVDDIVILCTRRVVKNGRAFLLADIFRNVLVLVARANGEIVAEIISAKPLGAEQQEGLEAQFKTVFGKSVTLKTEIDENLLAGMIVKVGSQMIDGSLRGKLDALKSTLNAENE